MLNQPFTLVSRSLIQCAQKVDTLRFTEPTASLFEPQVYLALSPSCSATETRLNGIGNITHVFYAALQPAANFFEEVAPNLAMLTNTVETVERFSGTFRKVVPIEGAKFYGARLGPYKTPAKGQCCKFVVEAKICVDDR